MTDPRARRRSKYALRGRPRPRQYAWVVAIRRIVCVRNGFVLGRPLWY